MIRRELEKLLDILETDEYHTLQNSETGKICRDFEEFFDVIIK